MPSFAARHPAATSGGQQLHGSVSEHVPDLGLGSMALLYCDLGRSYTSVWAISCLGHLRYASRTCDPWKLRFPWLRLHDSQGTDCISILYFPIFYYLDLGHLWAIPPYAAARPGFCARGHCKHS